MNLLKIGTVVRSVTLLSILTLLTALEAVAQAPAGPMPTTAGTISRIAVMFIIVYLIFHFLVTKPQKMRLKEQQDLLSSLKKGDQVVTSGGIIGKVAGTENGFTFLELSPNVKVKFETAHISRKIEKAG